MAVGDEKYNQYLKVFDSGESLVKEGAEDDNFYCLVEGKVVI